MARASAPVLALVPAAACCRQRLLRQNREIETSDGATLRVMDAAGNIDIRISHRATAKAREIFATHSEAGGVLRVYVQGGGCSGFQYGFDLEQDTEADDYIVERDGVRLVVDPLSYQYIVGSEIDYQEDLQGSQFVVRNPNANATCGCGLSFSI